MVDIAHRVGIRAPLQQVYKALASQDGVAGWWTRDVSQADGVLQLRFNAGGAEIGAMRLKILQQLPDQRVLWEVLAGPEEWLGTTIRFELKQEADYSIVIFSHEGWQQRVEFLHHCSTKWAVFLLSLKALLETGHGQPSPDDIKIDNWN